MTDDAMVRAEANFAAAKELCRIGHAECSYGGMSSAHGYWLAAEGCELNHGETCDLCAACDGAPAETGFRGSEPDAEILYWVWRVCACQPCADLYVAAHPEWKRPDSDAPKPTHDEIMARLHGQVKADRAAMSPAQREASDMMTNLMLYGQHPAPESPLELRLAGLAGVFGDAIPYQPAVAPIRDAPQWPVGIEAGAWSTVRSDEIVFPDPGYVGRLQRGTDPLETVVNAVVADEVRDGHSIAKAKWAPADCTCPWPWPMSGGRHILTSCPHYTAPVRPVAGVNPFAECRRVDQSWIHAALHTCPTHARGRR